MARPRKDDGPSTPEWIVTFSDIISLLVTFFVLLLTYSDINNQKLVMVKGAIQGSLGLLDANKRDAAGLESRSVSFIKTPRTKYSELPGPDHDQDEDKLSYPDPQDQPLPLEKTMDRTCFRLKTDIIFAPGSTKLPANATATLESVANVMRHYDNHLLIKGYADIDKGAMKDYRQAATRAYRVWDYLVKDAGIAPQRLAIAACDLNSVASSDDALARKNARRVEIIIWNQTPEIRLPEERSKWRNGD